MRLYQLRLQRDRLGHILRRLLIEAIRAQHRQSQISPRVFRIHLKRFVIQLCRLDVVEPLMKQHSVSHAPQRRTLRLRNRNLEFLLRLLVILQPPVPLRHPIRITTPCQRLKASRRLHLLPMQPQRPAPFRRSRTSSRRHTPPNAPTQQPRQHQHSEFVTNLHTCHSLCLPFPKEIRFCH